MKPSKKISSRHKQSSIKTSSDKDRHPKSKSETETSSKDLTELEKEMFSNKITDLEAKLDRKQQLCTFMEEEKQFFEAEYEGKKVLKKESMALLNQTYQDFHLELLLLESELRGMEEIASKKTLNRKETFQATIKMEKLKKMELKLEKKMNEAEKNVDGISNLMTKLNDLRLQICKKNEYFKAQISNLNTDFKLFIERLQDQLNTLIEGIIKDKALKLHLLPLPYQALFESGMLGSIWFESVLETCENLIQQNAEINKNIQQIKTINNEAKKASQNAFSIVVLSKEAEELMNSMNQDFDSPKSQKHILSNIFQEYETQMKYLLQLNNMNLLLERDIIQLMDKTKSLEQNIIQQETVKDNFDENSNLLQIIIQVKDIIIKELQ